MKKLVAPAWLTGWLTGIIPTSLFKLGRKTPWYRQSRVENIPWVAVALTAPLVLFAAWKGMRLLRSDQPQTH